MSSAHGRILPKSIRLRASFRLSLWHVLGVGSSRPHNMLLPSAPYPGFEPGASGLYPGACPTMLVRYPAYRIGM